MAADQLEVLQASVAADNRGETNCALDASLQSQRRIYRVHAANQVLPAARSRQPGAWVAWRRRRRWRRGGVRQALRLPGVDRFLHPLVRQVGLAAILLRRFGQIGALPDHSSCRPWRPNTADRSGELSPGWICRVRWSKNTALEFLPRRIGQGARLLGSHAEIGAGASLRRVPLHPIDHGEGIIGNFILRIGGDQLLIPAGGSSNLRIFCSGSGIPCACW